MNRLLSVENVANPAPVLEEDLLRLDKSVMAEKLSLDFSDFSAAASSQTITMKNLPTGSVVLGVRLETLEAWRGGSVSAATLEFGNSSDPDKYLTASDVFSSPSGFYASSASFHAEGWGAASPFRCTLRTTGDNVGNLTAGSAEIVVVYVTIN